MENTCENRISNNSKSTISILYFNLIHRGEVEMKFTLYDQTNQSCNPCCNSYSFSALQNYLTFYYKSGYALSPIIDRYT